MSMEIQNKYGSYYENDLRAAGGRPVEEAEEVKEAGYRMNIPVAKNQAESRVVCIIWEKTGMEIQRLCSMTQKDPAGMKRKLKSVRPIQTRLTGTLIS